MGDRPTVHTPGIAHPIRRTARAAAGSVAIIACLLAATAAVAPPAAAGNPSIPTTTRAAAPFVLYADVSWYLQADTSASCTAMAQDAILAQARLRDMKPKVFARPTPYPALYAGVLTTLRGDWSGLEDTIAWAARSAASCPRSQLTRIARAASGSALLALKRDALLLELLTAYPTGDTARIKADAKIAAAWRVALVNDTTGARAGARSTDLVRRPDWWLGPLSAAIALGVWNTSTWDAQIVAWNRAVNAGDRDAAADLPRPW